MRFPKLNALAVASMLLACGENNFTGNSAKKDAAPAKKKKAEEVETSEAEAVKAEPESKTPAPAEQTEVKLPVAQDKNPEVDPTKVLGGTPEDEAILRCLANWGINTFPKEGLAYKTLETHSFGPFAAANITDDDETKEKQLVLVKASTFGPISNIDLKLMNPKGYYCIETASFSVSNTVRIIRDCDAKIGSEKSSSLSVFFDKNSTKVGC